MITKDFEDNLRSLASPTDPMQHGLVLAKPTGNFLDDDPTYIEVILEGKIYYAKPCFSFGSWNPPSKAWLQKYKDEVMVWLAFEHGNPAHAVYLGINPLDNKNPKDFDKIIQRKTVKFVYEIDDEKETFSVKHELGNKIVIAKDSITVKSKEGKSIIIKNSVILGLGTGVFSAVKSEVLEAQLSTALNAIANDVLVVDVLSKTAIHSPPVKKAISDVLSTLVNIRSLIVKLD